MSQDGEEEAKGGCGSVESTPAVHTLALDLPLQRQGGELVHMLRRLSAVLATTCDGDTCCWKPTGSKRFDWNRRFLYMRPHPSDCQGARLVDLVGRFFADDVYGAKHKLGFLFLYVVCAGKVRHCL